MVTTPRFPGWRASWEDLVCVCEEAAVAGNVQELERDTSIEGARLGNTCAG